MEKIRKEIEIYAKDGKQTDYIPALAEVNPDQFGICLTMLDDLSLDVVKRKVHLLGFLLLPMALLPLASQIALVTLCLQLNCAMVPLIVTRPMIGTIPFLSLLLFT